MKTIVWIVIVFITSTWTIFPDTEKFHFLIEGEEIEYTNKIKILRLGLLLEIDFTEAESDGLIARVKAVTKKWQEMPCFADNAEPDIKKNYFMITDPVAKILLKLLDVLPTVLSFTKPSVATPDHFGCVVKYTFLTKEDMGEAVFNLEKAFEKIDTQWTGSSINSDHTKDLVLRNFAEMLTRVTVEWITKVEDFLSLAETLSSHKLPDKLQSKYEEANCVNQVLFEEAVKIIDCSPTGEGYFCDLEVTIPMTLTRAKLLLPVHYNSIRIRGETQENLLINLLGDHAIKILNCDHYEFSENPLPLCETKSLDPNCNNALNNGGIAQIISQCNFTKCEPKVGIRTVGKGILIQGEKVITKIQDGMTQNYNLLTNKSPIIVFAPNNILLLRNHIEQIFASETKTQPQAIIESKLTQSDIKILEQAYYWKTFREDFDTEDALDYTLLLLQIVLYPVVLWGFGVAIKNRQQLLKSLTKAGKSQKSIYRTNKRELARLK